MKIFPTRYYRFKLINNDKTSLDRLTRRTEFSKNLISTKTDKSFIGEIQDNQFRIITSDIGKGAFCVLSGKIENGTGEIRVEVNKAIRIIFSILFFLPVIAFIIGLFKEVNNFTFLMAIVAVLQVLMIRFIFLEIFFRVLSKQSLNKFRDVVDVEILAS